MNFSGSGGFGGSYYNSYKPGQYNPNAAAAVSNGGTATAPYMDYKAMGIINPYAYFNKYRNNRP